MPIPVCRLFRSHEHLFQGWVADTHHHLSKQQQRRNPRQKRLTVIACLTIHKQHKHCCHNAIDRIKLCDKNPFHVGKSHVEFLCECKISELRHSPRHLLRAPDCISRTTENIYEGNNIYAAQCIEKRLFHTLFRDIMQHFHAKQQKQQHRSLFLAARISTRQKRSCRLPHRHFSAAAKLL